MKRNDQLVMQILETLEESDREHLTASKLREMIGPTDEAKQREVTHHLRIMADVGYINITDSSGVRLTWNGHDELKKSPKHMQARSSALSF